MVIIYAIELVPLEGYEPKRYIGCTSGKLAKRVREHKCMLRKGTHHCKPLQRAWNESPGASLRGFWLDLLHGEPTIWEKREAEIKWMKSYDERGELFNEHLISFQPCALATERGIEASRKSKGRRWLPETNEKRRLAQLGIPKGHGAKISATKRAKKLQVMR